MSITKKLKGIFAALLCMSMLAGCSDSTNSSSQQTSSEASTASEAETEASKPEEQTSAAESDSQPETESTVYPESMKITALKGPTAMGMVKMMAENETADRVYAREFEIIAAVDEIAPMVIQGKTDIVCVPANLASVLYNKTEGNVQVLAINTLGIIYIVENGNTVTSLDDLKGKTIYASGKGATPEYALNYILNQNGINPETDVTIEWKSEHSECLTSLLTDEGSVALLPQPFVTTAQMKNEGINVAISITEEWDKLDNGSACLTGAVIVRKEFAEAYPEAIESFMTDYAASVEFVNNNIPEAAELVGYYDIVPAAVAEKAIPNCNIVFIDGAEMKEKLSGYLGVLYEQVPASVGGKLPADDFYYGA
ncbi:MAG: ABC transporter substrate-binding protein [Oscillospiraceae bacterium]